jgi:hypothetical protein
MPPDGGPRDPKNGQFTKGKSGNPNGRPRKAPSVGDAILGAINEKVPIRENGRNRRVTKLEATAKQFANRGASGDTRAGKVLIDLAQKAEEKRAAAATKAADLSASDLEILERMKARLALVLAEEARDVESR